MARSLNAKTNVRKNLPKIIYTPRGWGFGRTWGWSAYVGNVMGCVDYSVSGSGAVSRHKWGWGAGGVAIPAVYTHRLRLTPDDRCPSPCLFPPCVYTALVFNGFSGLTLSKSLRCPESSFLNCSALTFSTVSAPCGWNIPAALPMSSRAFKREPSCLPPLLSANSSFSTYRFVAAVSSASTSTVSPQAS